MFERNFVTKINKIVQYKELIAIKNKKEIMKTEREREKLNES